MVNKRLFLVKWVVVYHYGFAVAHVADGAENSWLDVTISWLLLIVVDYGWFMPGSQGTVKTMLV